MLSPLDILVDRMMRQNPNERPEIDEVILELRLFRGQLIDILEVIRDNLTPALSFEIDKNTLRKILDRACEDILSAKYIFENKTIEECERYNHNYHMNIGYKIDDYLKGIYLHELVYNECLMKFRYESNVYRNGSKYTPLNLDNDEEHIKLFEKLKTILNRFIIEDGDLSGEILKLFSSCCDYHCEEILNNIENRIEKQLADLENSPILYIILSLKEAIRINKDILNSLDIEEHILINWDRTKTYEENPDDLNLTLNIAEENDEQIFISFHKKWDAVISKLSTNKYSVKFMSYEEYNRFKNYSLEISRPYYVFEGDVLDLIRIEREYNDIVELKILDSFDTKNTLAKILGLRSDY